MAHWLVRVRTTEEIDGKLKGRTEAYIVNVETIEESQRRVHDYFRGMTVDYEIRSTGKTGIVGYIDGTGKAIE